MYVSCMYECMVYECMCGPQTLNISLSGQPGLDLEPPWRRAGPGIIPGSSHLLLLLFFLILLLHHLCLLHLSQRVHSPGHEDCSRTIPPTSGAGVTVSKYQEVYHIRYSDHTHHSMVCINHHKLVNIVRDQSVRDCEYRFL